MFIIHRGVGKKPNVSYTSFSLFASEHGCATVCVCVLLFVCMKESSGVIECVMCTHMCECVDVYTHSSAVYLKQRYSMFSAIRRPKLFWPYFVLRMTFYIVRSLARSFVHSFVFFFKYALTFIFIICILCACKMCNIKLLFWLSFGQIWNS